MWILSFARGNCARTPSQVSIVAAEDSGVAHASATTEAPIIKPLLCRNDLLSINEGIDYLIDKKQSTRSLILTSSFHYGTPSNRLSQACRKHPTNIITFQT